jgi:hypothetical protein
MRVVASVLGLSRSNLIERRQRRLWFDCEVATVSRVTDADGVKIEWFETVDEFLASLRRAADITARRRFWFPGVPDATLSLLPSALRVNPSPFKEPVTLATGQLLQEGGALWRFFEAAHYGGLTIPNWSDVEGYLHGRVGHDYEKAREFIALAQHYGTPMTLLDWTLDPYVAAYFAATDMDRKYEMAQDMVVWWLIPYTRTRPVSKRHGPRSGFRSTSIRTHALSGE